MPRIRSYAGVLAASLVVLSAVAACGRTDKAVVIDDELKRDLAAVGSGSVELAPKAGQSQVVVSAIEGGPTSAPERSKTPPKTSQPRPAATKAVSPVERVASAPRPAPVSSPATQTSPDVVAPVEPAPLPPVKPQPVAPQRSGPYKTEAEIFRQMPWIKP